MSKIIALAVPITKGKEQDFRKFISELTGKYYNDFRELRKRYNIHERTYHQVTPQGELVVVTMEGDNPEQGLRDISNEKSDFMNWFSQKLKDIHNYDLTQISQVDLPELVADSMNKQQLQSTTKLIAFAVPVLRGKETNWNELLDELNTRWKNEFTESRKRLNVHERTFSQVTPDGVYTIVTLEGDNPEQSLMQFGKGNDDFTRWFSQKVKEVHNYDLNAPPPFPLPELIVDSKKQQVKA